MVRSQPSRLSYVYVAAVDTVLDDASCRDSLACCRIRWSPLLTLDRRPYRTLRRTDLQVPWRKPLVGRTFDMDQLPDAVRYLQSGVCV